MMRIQVITRDNGFGLTKDIQVIREALEPAGHEVVFTPWDRPRKGVHFHWNIHLELLAPIHFPSGGINVFVPNPEWMMNDYPRYFGAVDMVWAKTHDCKGIMDRLHGNVVYTGWTSPDTDVRVDPSPAMVHFGGDSISKGTGAVLQAAGMVPHIPITVVWKQKWRGPVPKNVRLIQGRLDGEEYAKVKRSSIHLCPSSAEGFGHYINEARSMGAVIISTAEAPMNELVTPDFGFLVPSCSDHQMRFAIEHRVCPDSLAECMGYAWNCVTEHGATWGLRARKAYEQDREAFTRTINEIVK